MRWLRELGAALTTTALVVAAFWPALGLLVDGRGWWPPALTVVLITAVAGALSRLLLNRTWPGWLLALAVSASVVLVLAVPASHRRGPLPTSDTGEGVRAAADQLIASVINDVAPVRPIPEITAAVALVVALAALTTEACTRGTLPFTDRRRIPATAVPVLLLPLLVASFVVDHPVGAGLLVPTLASALAALLIPVRAATGGGTAKPARSVGPSVAHLPERGAWLRAAGHTGAVAATAVAATITMLLAPSLLVPAPSTGIFPVGSRWISPGASSGVDPFLDLSRDLRSPLSKDIITYAVNGDQDPYLRTSVVSDLFAPTWGPGNRRSSIYREAAPFADDLADGYGLGAFPNNDEFAGTGYAPSLLYSVGQQAESEQSETTVGIDAHDYASPWLLVPQGTFSMNDLPGTYRLPAGTSTLKHLNERSVKNAQYTAVLAKEPDLDRLRSAESMDDVRKEYEAMASEWEDELSEFDEDGNATDDFGDTWTRQDIAQTRIPGQRDQKDRAKIPDSIREAASDAVAEADASDSPYEIAQALRAYLRGGEFTYSESAPIRTDRRTGGVSMVESFLEDKYGYCVHFASAMALMARAEGIPSRIAVGYTPGTPGADGTVSGISGTLREVNSKQAHAWTELYFVDVGWVPFDATPGFAGTDVDRAIAADSAQDTPVVEDPLAGRGTQSAQASQPSVASSTSAAATSSAAAQPSDQPGGTRGHWGWWVAGAALLAAIPGIAWLNRRAPGYLWRLRERRILRAGDQAARRAWVEVARLAGVTGAAVWAQPAPASASQWFPENEAAARIAAAVDQERYAAGSQRHQDPQVLVEDLRLVRDLRLASEGTVGPADGAAGPAVGRRH